jgi:hypothetical protein
MLPQVVRLARELAEKTVEGRVVMRLECQEGDSRASLVVMRNEEKWSELDCDLEEAFELLQSAHEMFRVRGHGALRVEIVARNKFSLPSSNTRSKLSPS